LVRPLGRQLYLRHWQAITGLVAVGVPIDDPAIAAAADWLADPSAGVRRLGRIARQLRVAPPSRPRHADRLANRLGNPGLVAAGMEGHPASSAASAI